MKFRQYLQNEGYEIFGFDDEQKADAEDRNPKFQPNERDKDAPLRRFDVDYAAKLVSHHSLGQKHGRRIFFDKIQWGEGVGAVQLRFSTNFQVIIERLSYDLQGEPVWVAKNMFNLNKEYFGGKEEAVAYELMQALDRVNDGPVDGPKGDFKDFEKLVKKIAHRTGKVVNDPLFFEELRKLSDDEYIIKFGIRGHGVQAPDQRRVEQTQIQLKYHTKKGTIQVIETNIESSLARHDWVIMPSDFELIFMPSQPADEITNTLSTIMKYF
jgi:hypothetical protein